MANLLRRRQRYERYGFECATPTGVARRGPLCAHVSTERFAVQLGERVDLVATTRFADDLAKWPSN
jgi:hypothetical protein